MVGRIRIHIKNEITPVVYADIITIDTREEGEYRSATHLEPQEYGTLIIEGGMAECFDIGESDIINYIEIDQLETELEYCPSIDIKKDYMDFTSGCRVIEF